MWHLHDFFLCCITIEENFVINPIIIFKLHFLCTVHYLAKSIRKLSRRSEQTNKKNLESPCIEKYLNCVVTTVYDNSTSLLFMIIFMKIACIYIQRDINIFIKKSSYIYRFFFCKLQDFPQMQCLFQEIWQLQ